MMEWLVINLDGGQQVAIPWDPASIALIKRVQSGQEDRIVVQLRDGTAYYGDSATCEIRADSVIRTELGL
jgi:hypothetical protein